MSRRAFFIKSSTPQRALHNVQWMKKIGRGELSLYQAVDMPVDLRHVVIYEAGCEDVARKDPHWAEHDFKPVTEAELEKMVEEMCRREVMPEKVLCNIVMTHCFSMLNPIKKPLIERQDPADGSCLLLWWLGCL